MLQRRTGMLIKVDGEPGQNLKTLPKTARVGIYRRPDEGPIRFR